MTEQELRVEWQRQARECRTLADLNAFFDRLNAHEHDYGSCCVAIGAFAIAAAWVAARSDPIGRGGITGFQAGAVMWEMIGGWDAHGSKDNPQRLIDYGDLLYPQYAGKFTMISPDTWDWAKGEAARLLAENVAAHQAVRDHWESVAAGTVPFGLKVGE